MAEKENKDPIEDKVDGYKLINCIATGKQSQIWEVAEEGATEHVAMKLLLPEALQDKDEVKVLKFEAKVCKALDHPNIVRLLKLVTKKDFGYIILDLFKSLNLKSYIMNDLNGVQMRLSKIMEAVCPALGHMHDRGWVHKDVKPDNILMNRGSEVRLIDFSLSVRAASGIVKLVGKSRSIKGTRTYIAPETIRKKLSTPQTDMYSLGITLYEVLTGRVPFSGKDPKDLLRMHIGVTAYPPSAANENVTPEMDRFVGRLLSKNPKNRPESMQELLIEFRAIRPFKEEIKVEATTDDDGTEVNLKVGARLDSRSDAIRQAAFRQNPEMEKEYERAKKEEADTRKKQEASRPRMASKDDKTKPTKPASAQPPASQQPAPQQPAQPMAPMPPAMAPVQQMPPVMYPPQQPMPPGMYPPQAVPPPPGMYPQQQPMYPGYAQQPMPTQPVPPQPGYPPQQSAPPPNQPPQIPPQPAPIPAQQQPQAPQQPAPQRPAQQQPAQQQPVAPQSQHVVPQSNTPTAPAPPSVPKKPVLPHQEATVFEMALDLPTDELEDADPTSQTPTKSPAATRPASNANEETPLIDELPDVT